MLCSALISSIIAGNASADVLLGVATAFSGPAASDFSVKLGVDLGVQELNAAGGVLGQQVRVIEVDDYCAGEQALAAANALVAEQVDFVIGHTCSDAAIPASQVYAEAGIPLLTTMATNPRLTEQGLTNVFRICGRDDAQGAIAANLLAAQWGQGNVAILHDGRVYGRGLAEQARQALNAQGVTEVLFEPIDPELLDYADVADRVQAAKVDVLYYAGTSRPAGLIVRELRERGDDVQLISGDSINQELFTMLAGETGDGTLFTAFPDAQSLPDPTDVMSVFRAGDVDPNNQGALLAYAAVQVWAAAVEQTGGLEPDGLIEALHSGTFDTIYGRIGFDEKGDVTGYDPFTWYVWQDGEIAPARLTN
jgi:branched-chain amino acid transport system substrate-binding protein